MRITVTSYELEELISKIQNKQADFHTTEVKMLENDVPDKLYETLSSFSNQNEGGVIVFGLYKDEKFTVSGVNDVKALQKKIMEQCCQMEPPVKAFFTVAETDGKNVVAAEIPPLDILERPCFNLAKGISKGSYIRVGDADVNMTKHEIYSYEAYREKYQDDIRPVERADIASLNIEELNEYLKKLKEKKPGLSGLSDKQIMNLMGIVKDEKPTLTAEMLFGIYPQAFFPQFSIMAACVSETGEIFPNSAKRIEGKISKMLDEALDYVNKNTKSLNENGKGSDFTDYPVNAVRQVILNAIVHRDYSIHTEGMSIQLKIFRDRLEVISPGGLYGRTAVDGLCKAQNDVRNPVLAAALEVLEITENRYSGVSKILSEMSEQRLSAPVFQNIKGEFKVTLYKNNTKRLKPCQDTDSILDFCRTPRSRQELVKHLKVNSSTYAIKTYIQPLIDKGLIKLSNPSSPGSRNQKYYTVR